jgi:hypothetical protein
MNNVQNPSDSVFYTLSSENFRIYQMTPINCTINFYSHYASRNVTVQLTTLAIIHCISYWVNALRPLCWGLPVVCGMTSGFLSSISSAVTRTGPLSPCRDTVSRFPVLAVDPFAPGSVIDSGDPVLVCWSSSSWSKQSPHTPPRTRRVTTATSPTTPRVTTMPARTHSTGVTCGNAGKGVAAATHQRVSVHIHNMMALTYSYARRIAGPL